MRQRWASSQTQAKCVICASINSQSRNAIVLALRTFGLTVPLSTVTGKRKWNAIYRIRYHVVASTKFHFNNTLKICTISTGIYSVEHKTVLQVQPTHSDLKCTQSKSTAFFSSVHNVHFSHRLYSSQVHSPPRCRFIMIRVGTRAHTVERGADSIHRFLTWRSAILIRTWLIGWLAKRQILLNEKAIIWKYLVINNDA